MSQSPLIEKLTWRFNPRLEILFTANEIIGVIWDAPKYTPATCRSFIRVLFLRSLRLFILLFSIFPNFSHLRQSSIYKRINIDINEIKYCSELDIYIYDQLGFNKVAKAIQWVKRTIFSVNDPGAIGHPYAKKKKNTADFKLYLRPHRIK